MNKAKFPLQFYFKIATFANDFIVKDADDKTIAYVRQKMMKFIEDISVYSNEDKTEEIFRIKADRWLDFSASYAFYDRNGNEIGRVTRKGWKSFWRAHYEIYNQAKVHEYTIREENPWAKVADSFLGEIPVLGILTGYLFHPSYAVESQNGNKIARLKKEPSFFGRKFAIEKMQDVSETEEQRIILGLMMMVLLERQRG